MKRSNPGSGVAKRVARTPSIGRPSQLPTDFIALGSKSKPDASGNQHKLPAKKPKLGSNSSPVTSHSVMSSSRHMTASPDLLSGGNETSFNSFIGIDCPPEDLVDTVIQNIDLDDEYVENLLCGAIHKLRSSRMKPDHITVLSLLYLTKLHPEIFNRDKIIQNLAGLLNKDNGPEYLKTKVNNIVAIITCNIIMAVLRNYSTWPSVLIQVFLDDSLGERIWVDNSECQSFVKNIVTAFRTKLDETIIFNDGKEITDLSEKPLPRYDMNIEKAQKMVTNVIRERLAKKHPDIGAMAVGSNAAMQGGVHSSGRNLIRTVTAACGIQDVREMCAQKLEIWLQNTKLMKPAQDLMTAICLNCNTHSQNDVNVIESLTKMRAIKKNLLPHYLTCIKKLIDAHPENLKTILTCVLYNELSTVRNQMNMSIVVGIIQMRPVPSAQTLAWIFQDLLFQQEDYLRAIRGLLREIVRSSKYNFEFTTLSVSLMQKPDMERFNQLDQAHQDRFVISTCDLICLVMMLSVSPLVKEATAVVLGKKPGENPDVDYEQVYKNFKQSIASIQQNALWWLLTIVTPQLSTKTLLNEFNQLVYKVLFLLKEPNSPTVQQYIQQCYCTKDNWPPDVERIAIFKACHDVPVLEASILRLSAIGLSQEHPLTPQEALDIIAKLVGRVGGIFRSGVNPIVVQNRDLIDTILALSQYHYPGNIKLPADYSPPSLAISQYYWNGLQTVLVIAAFNPTTVGKHAWNHYPMLRVFMEMALVNKFSYPPVTVVDVDERNHMVAKEQQLALNEKSKVLEFESHLAAATTRQVITEESSLLLSQLMSMNTRGPARMPPEWALQHLDSLCSRLQLGTWLCKSRDPYYLLDIINRYGENQQMSWLPDLISQAKGDVDVLPIQCLCEFLLLSEAESEKLTSDGLQITQLISQIKSLILSENSEDSLKVMQYFLKRLSSPHVSMRTRARDAIACVIWNCFHNDDDIIQQTPIKNDDFQWLLVDMMKLPHYATLQPHILSAIQSAIMVETDPLCNAAYIVMLSNQLDAERLDEEVYLQTLEVAKKAAKLLIDRRILIGSVLTLTGATLLSGGIPASCHFLTSLNKIFYIQIQQAMEQDRLRRMESTEQENGIPWSASQDEIYVKWPETGENAFRSATIHILIQQATIILLGYGPPSNYIITDDVTMDQYYVELLDIWFSPNGNVIPQAYLLDTQEAADLLPDWLRLRMLRVGVSEHAERLVVAASCDLQINQIILFIQSFGIPIQSMDILLNAMDVLLDPEDSEYSKNVEEVLECTTSNLAYMVDLLQVQFMRGCTNGERFTQLLKSKLHQENSSTSVSQEKASVTIDLCNESSDAMEVDDVQTDVIKIDDNESMKTALLKLFKSEHGHVKMWTSFMKALHRPHRKKVVANTCLQVLVSLIKSADFLRLFKSASFRACQILRYLNRMIYLNPGAPDSRKTDFTKLMQKIDIMPQGSSKEKQRGGRINSNRVVEFASNWLSKHQKGGKKVRKPSSNEDHLRHSDWAILEEHLRSQLAFLNKDDEIKSKVGLVAQILLEEISHRRSLVSRGQTLSDDSCFTSVGTTGMLVDWLQLLDPELLVHSPPLQRKLLFEAPRNDILTSTPKSFTFDQAYLLSLLAEHCNWTNIRASIEWLLSDANSDPTLLSASAANASAVDPKAALDFLWVVLQSPKIWQGRENKNTAISETVFNLNVDQFCKLLCYVVFASVSQQTSTSTDSVQNVQNNNTSYTDLLSIYLTKFGQARQGRRHMCKIVEFLRDKLKSLSITSPYTSTWWRILAQLYVIQPNLIVWNTIQVASCDSETEKGFSQTDLDTFGDTVSTVDVGSDCATDVLTCSLLNRMGYVKSGANLPSQIGTKMDFSSLESAVDANLLLTKISSSRPYLVLRQLRLLSSILCGRTRLDFQEFKLQNNLPLVLNILTILKLLSTPLFRPMHAPIVAEIVNVLWQVLKNYCHRARRQMSPIFQSTLRFTLIYLKHSPQDACGVLSKHAMTMQQLMKIYHDHDHLINTLNSIRNVISMSWLIPSCDNVMIASQTPMIRSNILTITQETNLQMLPIYKDLLNPNQDIENIKQALGDFEDSSKRHIDDVTPYVTTIMMILHTTRDDAVRKLAISALLRHCKQQPGDGAKVLLPFYAQTLQREKVTSLRLNVISPFDAKLHHSILKRMDRTTSSILYETSNIIKSLLPTLPETVILCRDEAPLLLGAAFDNASVEPSPSDDVCTVLARAMWLLAGKHECLAATGS